MAAVAQGGRDARQPSLGTRRGESHVAYARANNRKRSVLVQCAIDDSTRARRCRNRASDRGNCGNTEQRHDRAAGQHARRTSRRPCSPRRQTPNARHLHKSGERRRIAGYTSDWPDQYRPAATYIDQILKGAKPEELPVQQPAKFQLMINLKRAKALGLTVLASLLARADEVIE